MSVSRSSLSWLCGLILPKKKSCEIANNSCFDWTISADLCLTIYMNKTTATKSTVSPSTSVDYGSFREPAEQRSLPTSHRWVRWTGKEVGAARYYVIESMAGWLIDTETTTSDLAIAEVVFAKLVDQINHAG